MSLNKFRRSINSLPAALCLLAAVGCGSFGDQKPAIEKAIKDHLASRSDLAINQMVLDVKDVKVEGDKAGADKSGDKSGDKSAKSGKGEKGDKAGKGRPVPVVMGKVERRDVSIDLSVVGRAEAYSTVSVRSRVDGQVQAVRFTAGQYVKKDQVLIELDPRPLEAQWRQTQGNLARDQAQLAKARADQAPAERTGEARARQHAGLGTGVRGDCEQSAIGRTDHQNGDRARRLRARGRPTIDGLRKLRAVGLVGRSHVQPARQRIDDVIAPAAVAGLVRQRRRQAVVMRQVLAARQRVGEVELGGRHRRWAQM